MKANYASRGDQLRLRWRNGVIVRERAEIADSSDRRPVNEVFVGLLDERNAEDRPVSDNSKAANYAPRIFAELPVDRRAGYGTKQFKIAMESLFAASEIAVAPYGRKSDMRKKIVRRVEMAMAA
jgi:hypothetical protein